MKSTSFSFFLALLITFSSPSWSETLYVTDEFKVTLRTGTSTSNSILTMLKSGEAVTFIEHDKVSKYSLVETGSGKKGYVLSRFLDQQPSGRERHTKLKVRSERQKETIKTLKSDLNGLKQQNKASEQQAEDLSTQLSDTANELEQLKSSTRNTIAIIERNKTQSSLINQLEKDKATLLTENNDYKDSTAMDWFLRGSGVSLLAFLLGIIVTRIKWKKSESWGDF